MNFDISKNLVDSNDDLDTGLSFVLCSKYCWLRVPVVLVAIKNIELAGGKKAVTPREFKAILAELNERVLRGNISGPYGSEGRQFVSIAEEVSEFLNSKTLSWEKIAEYGRELESSRSGGFDYFVSLGQLMMLCREINIVLGWMPKPWAPSFCDVCWRFVMGKRKRCSIHTQVDYSGFLRGSKSDAEREACRDNYWSARRLAPTFLQNLRFISSVDKRELRRSGWRDAISRGDLADWLKRNRPIVYGLLESEIRNAPLGGIVPLLVERLDYVEGESLVEKKCREEFHAKLVSNRRDVFDMVRRAEAWLSAQAARRSNWGGVRKGEALRLKN